MNSVLFTDPQIPLFSNFFIKNESYDTINTFKNYFTTVFSVFNFQFQQNKLYLNVRYISKKTCYLKNLLLNRYENESYDTINTFKNYFTTVFSVFNFQFQQNKLYLNVCYISKNDLLFEEFVIKSL